VNWLLKLKNVLTWLGRFLNWRNIIMTFPKGAAALLAEKDLKGSLVSQQSNKFLLAGITNILPSDPERINMVVVNLSASELYVGFNAQTDNNQGIILPPNGGFLSMSVVDDYELVTLPFYVFAPSQPLNIYILSTRRETGLQE
jgi:hypothetical protein